METKDMKTIGAGGLPTIGAPVSSGTGGDVVITPDVKYESYTAASGDTSITDILPEEGEEDVIYRVGNWDGTEADATKMSEYAWDGSDYTLLRVVDSIGEVFDISAYNASGGTLATYADLAAALGTSGANVPEGVRKGGMSVKYVQSSDNNYVQFRYMKSDASTAATFTNVANWQGVDAEPIMGSKNLVTSGGVFNKINDIEYYITGNLTKELNWSNGWINDSGLVSNSSLSRFSQPFVLKKGETVTVGTKNTNIAIISSTNSDSVQVGDHVDVIQMTSPTSQFETYSYTALEDIKIVLCVLASNYSLSFYNTNNFEYKVIEADNVPIPGSQKLITSGGVANGIEQLREKLSPRMLNNYFLGANNAWAAQIINGLKPGYKYRLIVRNPDYDKSGITQTGVYLFAIYNRKIDETTTLLAGEDIRSSGVFPTIDDYYDFIVPDDSKEIIVGGRAALNEKVEFMIICIQSDEPENDTFSIPQKIIDYSLLFKGAIGAVESFLFFTDPHWYNRYEDAGLNPIYKDKFDTLIQMWEKSPTDFVLCGGDWLTASKQSIAIEDLANIDALMNKMIGSYYPVFGNHDDNYQGELDETEDTSANDGTVAKETIVNLWFRKWGKAYYTFKGSSSKFFIFDSGIDWNSTMDEYKWGQIAWFAQGLLDNQDDHIVLGMHIVCNSGDVFTQNTAPLANNILLMAQAFNAKTTITLNGIAYDFSNAHGTVHCALCGHTHYDASAVINGIPVFCTAAARDGIFDLILIDYGAGKLKSIRIGTGSNRELNLV